MGGDEGGQMVPCDFFEVGISLQKPTPNIPPVVMSLLM